jgi:hypothetical protein
MLKLSSLGTRLLHYQKGCDGLKEDFGTSKETDQQKDEHKSCLIQCFGEFLSENIRGVR